MRNYLSEMDQYDVIQTEGTRRDRKYRLISTSSEAIKSISLVQTTLQLIHGDIKRGILAIDGNLCSDVIPILVGDK